MDRQISISPYYLGRMVWEQAFVSFETEIDLVANELRQISKACEAQRSVMNQDTGSISFASMLSLYAIVRFMGVKSAFEIGTFIGKSALSIAKAMATNGGGQVFTCDGRNEFNIPLGPANVSITGFGRTKSTVALKAMLEQGRKFDFVHVDGRFLGQDVELLLKLLEPRAIIALDDFEGGEKGVIALTLLRQSEHFNNHVLVYPAEKQFLDQFGCLARSFTALLLPVDLIYFTNQ